MRFKIKLPHAIIAGLNAVSLTGALILTAAGGSIARSQSYNRAAEKWDPDGGSSQISCFFSDDSDFTTDSLGGLRAQIMNSLNAVSSGGELPDVPDAYSAAAGTADLRSDTLGRGDAELTAVGGDFFLFRDFSLLDGAYFSPNDLMQDGAVIERSLAWSLYGSDNVSGLNVYINGVKFYIAGVIDDPSDKYQKKTAGKTPRAYISYDGASRIALAGSPDGETADFKKVSCYECIMPDPVENYAYNTLNGYFEGMYSGKYHAVCNTDRFTPSVRAKAFKKLSSYAVRKDSVVYPYWENASRIAEFKLSPIYFLRRLALIVPIVTGVWLAFLLFKAIEKNGKKLITAAYDKYIRIMYDRRNRS